MTGGGFVEHESAWTFSETIARIVRTIEEVGMDIVCRIDHASAAEEVGMILRPSVVLFYGHPRGSTPILQMAPTAALDLPLRILIRETEHGTTLLGFHAAREILKRHSIPVELVDRLVKSQELLVHAVGSPGA